MRYIRKHYLVSQLSNAFQKTLSVFLITLFFVFIPSPTAYSEKPHSFRIDHLHDLSYPKTKWVKIQITNVPSNAYWEKVAQCETNSNWQNRGKYAGGLGIYTKGKFGDKDMGTWERWGGEEFAPSPDKATKEQQIIVANRIAVLGWKTIIHRDPKEAKMRGIPAVYEYDKHATGFEGWGCIKSKSTGKWRIGLPSKKHWHKYTYVMVPANKKMYCPQYEPLFYKYNLPVKLFSYIAWRESRCQPKVIGYNYHSGKSADDCKKVSPNCHAVKSYDSGLLQINSTWKTLTSHICKSSLGNLTVLQNPTCNVQVAKYLFANTKNGPGNWSIKVYLK